MKDICGRRETAQIGMVPMKRLSRSVILALVAVCASLAVAGAAIPKFGGTYVGSSASHK
jgi:hypothetical protein